MCDTCWVLAHLESVYLDLTQLKVILTGVGQLEQQSLDTQFSV
jgi:hypothetical protein